MNKLVNTDSTINLEYVKIDKDNFEIGYNIQKQIWEDEPDYENFKNKANSKVLNSS